MKVLALSPKIDMAHGAPNDESYHILGLGRETTEPRKYAPGPNRPTPLMMSTGEQRAITRQVGRPWVGSPGQGRGARAFLGVIRLYPANS